ncbi:glycosyltransferase family 39 protein [Inquilinus sp. Marseille-Q2685]|uniref:glycosyltransferase family 39 protein n=1 Tax=Inquilinus sp. Marseille-Q2685 TaxID=2866581 RepID=UPI001CE443FC|nr:glycosyltransferase family 39 protein [Inquilinus sp. Marseille-Q2685]
MSTEAVRSASVTAPPAILGNPHPGPGTAARSTIRNIHPLWVPAFLGASFLAWTLLPALLAGNLHPDTLEGLYWGQHWLWGYHKHPPLAAWSSEIVHAAFGSANWAYYALSQAFIATAFAAVWLVTRDIAGRRAALVAVVLLALTHFTTYAAPRFNPNTVQFAFWAWTMALFWRAVTRDRAVWWLLTGLVAGMGLLAKYSITVLLATLLAYLLLSPAGRRQFARPGLYLGLAAFLLVIAPHLLWLAQNDFSTLGYLAERSDGTLVGPAGHLIAPLAFLGDQVFAIAPMLLAAAIGLTPLGRDRIAVLLHLARRRLRSPAGCYLAFVYMVPIAALAFASAATGIRIRTMWGMSFVLAAPPLLALLLPALAATGLSAPRFRTAASALATTFVIGFAALMLVKPGLSGRPNIMNLDGPALSAAAEALWRKSQPGAPETVIGTIPEAGTVSLYGTARPQVFEDADPALSPWVDQGRLLRSGAVYASRREPVPGRPIAGLCPQDVTAFAWPARTALGTALESRTVWLAILPGRAAPAVTCPAA